MGIFAPKMNLMKKKQNNNIYKLYMPKIIRLGFKMKELKRCSICEKPLTEQNKSMLCHYHKQLENGAKWRSENREKIRDYQNKRYALKKAEKKQ